MHTQSHYYKEQIENRKKEIESIKRYEIEREKKSIEQEKRRIEDDAEAMGVKRTSSQVSDDLALFAVTWKKNNPLFTEEEQSSLIARQDLEAYNTAKGRYTGQSSTSSSSGGGPQGNPVGDKNALRAQRDEIKRKLENGEYPEQDEPRARQILADLNLQLSQ